MLFLDGFLGLFLDGFSRCCFWVSAVFAVLLSGVEM
jgi:hypothetical protein